MDNGFITIGGDLHSIGSVSLVRVEICREALAKSSMRKQKPVDARVLIEPARIDRRILPLKAAIARIEHGQNR